MSDADKYIYDETPIWEINWINKLFTTEFNINKIDDVYVWWVPYRTLDYIWTNTFTLNEAPPTDSIVSVDYFKI